MLSNFQEVPAMFCDVIKKRGGGVCELKKEQNLFSNSKNRKCIWLYYLKVGVVCVIEENVGVVYTGTAEVGVIQRKKGLEKRRKEWK